MESIETMDAELSVLETIYSSQNSRAMQLSQRDLAEASGLSLGMINTLIKRFGEKGWVTVRKINSRNINYVMTPAGINEIAKRTYRYFSRTAKTISLYREMIETFVMDAKRSGATTIVFAGVSELDFVFEYSCERHGLIFVKSSNPEKALKLHKEHTLLIRADVKDGEPFTGPGTPLVSIIAGN